MKSVIGSLGGLSHSDFRNFANERRTATYKNFVDGDLGKYLIYKNIGPFVSNFLDLRSDLSH